MEDADKLELERLRAENAKLKEKANAPLTFKIGEKGGLSIYGNGRFPTTLYASQWERLLERADDIKAFLKANAHKLATKE